jgi:hypothetical protein
MTRNQQLRSSFPARINASEPRTLAVSVKGGGVKTHELMREDYVSLRWPGRLKWLWFYWTWRLVTWIGPKLGRPYWWNGGRRYDGDPTVCQECKHVMRVRHAVHGYQSDGDGDVEGCSECPKCGHEL